MSSRNTARACLPGSPASPHPDASWKWRSCQETWHDITYITSSLRILPFSLLFKRRTADGARALHNTEVILRRAAGENKAIIRRIRRTFSQVALRLSCERCFDAGSELGSDVFLSHQMNLILLMQAALNARGVGGEPWGDESRARCRDVCLRLASERMQMFHKYWQNPSESSRVSLRCWGNSKGVHGHWYFCVVKGVLFRPLSFLLKVSYLLEEYYLVGPIQQDFFKYN